MGIIDIQLICHHKPQKVNTEPKPSSVNTPENQVPRELPPNQLNNTSWVSPSQPSEDSPEEVVSRESALSSMTRPEPSSRPSSRTSSETQSPTPSTPEERLSPLSMLSMHSRDKAEPSMVSVDEQFVTFYL